MSTPVPSRFSRLLRACDGVAATEFAIIAPAALALMSLAVAGGQSLNAYHKVVLAAHTVTDLVSRTVYQQDTSTSGAELLKQSELDTDLALSQMVMYPANTANVTATLSELKVDAANNQGTVVWSEGYNGATKLAVGTVVALDPSYGSAGAAYLLYGTVAYTFQPLGGVFSLPPMTLTSTEILTIRNARQITVQWGS